MQQMNCITNFVMHDNKLNSVHFDHSMGMVKAGEVPLFVYVSSVRRKDAFNECAEAVKRIAKVIPARGKEMFEDTSYQRNKIKRLDEQYYAQANESP